MVRSRMALASPAKPACPGGDHEKLLFLVLKGRAFPLGSSGPPCLLPVTVIVGGPSSGFSRYRMAGLLVIGSMGLSPFNPCDTKAASPHMRSPLETAAPKSSILEVLGSGGGTILGNGIFQPWRGAVHQPGSNEADRASRDFVDLL